MKIALFFLIVGLSSCFAIGDGDTGRGRLRLAFDLEVRIIVTVIMDAISLSVNMKDPVGGGTVRIRRETACCDTVDDGAKKPLMSDVSNRDTVDDGAKKPLMSDVSNRNTMDNGAKETLMFELNRVLTKISAITQTSVHVVIASLAACVPGGDPAMGSLVLLLLRTGNCDLIGKGGLTVDILMKTVCKFTSIMFDKWGYNLTELLDEELLSQAGTMGNMQEVIDNSMKFGLHLNIREISEPVNGVSTKFAMLGNKKQEIGKFLVAPSVPLPAAVTELLGPAAGAQGDLLTCFDSIFKSLSSSDTDGLAATLLRCGVPQSVVTCILGSLNTVFGILGGALTGLGSYLRGLTDTLGGGLIKNR